MVTSVSVSNIAALVKADPLADAAFSDLLCITMDLVSFYLAFE
jgi:hypothetical protein|tara:strand:+ start:1833 stop:1961 length:129 start_codon:yes stop_codon:yes gene_type:complete